MLGFGRLVHSNELGDDCIVDSLEGQVGLVILTIGDQLGSVVDMLLRELHRDQPGREGHVDIAKLQRFKRFLLLALV